MENSFKPMEHKNLENDRGHVYIFPLWLEQKPTKYLSVNTVINSIYLSMNHGGQGN